MKILFWVNLFLTAASLSLLIVAIHIVAKYGSHRSFVVNTRAQLAAYSPGFNEEPGRQSSDSSVPIEDQIKQALDQTDLGIREAQLNHIGQTIDPAQISRAVTYLAEQHQTGVHSLFNDLCSTWAFKNPTAALAWATNLPDDDARTSAILGIFHGWTDASPTNAAAAATALPPGDMRDEAMVKVAGEWGFRDAGGAAEWVSHFPAGKVRDDAIGPIMFWGQGQAPAAIAQMLDTIGDDNLTRKYGEQLAQIWLSRDDAAARAWIKRSPLPEDVKERLLKTNE